MVNAFVIDPIPALTSWPGPEDHNTVGAPHIPASNFLAIRRASGLARLVDGGGKGHRAEEGNGDEGSHLVGLGICKRERSF